MKRLALALIVFCAALAPIVALGADCAFEDLNDNGVFDGADVIVPDAAWIGGVAFVTVNPFVVPTGCDKTLVSVPLPSQGVSVTASKITYRGRLDYLPPGGRGVVLNATVGPLQLTGAFLRAGGSNSLPPAEIGVAQKAIALISGSTCTFLNSEIQGNRPVQDTRVGIRCAGDIAMSGTKVVGSRVTVLSLNGSVLASGGPAAFSLAALCDAQGNANGVSDAGDFPCSVNLGLLGVVNFADALALDAACRLQADPNLIHAINDPLIIVALGAGHDVDVQGASLVGKFRVVLAAGDGNLLLQGATIDHGQQLGLTVAGGARIFLFANPATATFLANDHVTLLGPSPGAINVLGTCMKSLNPVVFGTGGAVLGAPAAGCAQFPADFVAQLNAIL